MTKKAGKMIFMIAVLYFISPPGAEMSGVEIFIYFAGCIGAVAYAMAGENNDN